jgi:hypothetical protein
MESLFSFFLYLGYGDEFWFRRSLKILHVRFWMTDGSYSTMSKSNGYYRGRAPKKTHSFIMWWRRMNTNFISQHYKDWRGCSWENVSLRYFRSSNIFLFKLSKFYMRSFRGPNIRFSFICLLNFKFWMFMSVFGPVRVLSQRVNLCCVSLIWMMMQREYMGVYPGSGERRPYVQRGEVLYFLAPKCLRRGYKLWERELIPSLKEREYKGDCLRCWSSTVGWWLVLPFCPPS